MSKEYEYAAARGNGKSGMAARNIVKATRAMEQTNEYIEKETVEQTIKDYLKRIAENAELLDALSDVAWNAAIETAYTAASRIPPANVKPVVRGEWEPWERGEYDEPRPFPKYFRCSACKIAYVKGVSGELTWRFCPNCGAEMRKEVEQ